MDRLFSEDEGRGQSTSAIITRLLLGTERISWSEYRVPFPRSVIRWGACAAATALPAALGLWGEITARCFQVGG
jgi:hypothetical protein